MYFYSKLFFAKIVNSDSFLLIMYADFIQYSSAAL